MTALKEKNLEETIEHYLVNESKEYESGTDKTYNLDYLLDVGIFTRFLKQSQPDQWKQYERIYGEKSEESIARRFHNEVSNVGLIEVLRKGITDRGISFQVAYYRPETSFNLDSKHKYDCNILTCVRQFHYSKINSNSIDMVLLLNGIAIVSIELKNEYTGQDIEDSKHQFMYNRDPVEPFLRFKMNNLVYMCIDTSEACIATKLDKEKTWFIPFNLGSNGPGNKGGKGNPLVEGKYETYYVWEHVFSKDCLLNIIHNYVHLVKEKKKTEDGREYIVEKIIFPRYHQLDVVDKLVEDSRVNGPGKNYLIEHSAGSGKSNSIAWLAYRLMSLHNAADEKVFDSVIVITDRRNLDQQLQTTISSFNHNAKGVVYNIDKNAQQLLDALEHKKKIVVTTLQKFPVIYEDVSVRGQKYAIIVDEAHSSQSGISATKVKEAIGNGIDPETGEEYDFQDKLAKTISSHGKHSNLSYFAFTATPKNSTLETFGIKQSDGQYKAYHTYSMKQAIEEGFILDVLEHYATYETYYRVAKSVEGNPLVELKEGTKEITRFVKLHAFNLDQKAKIMIDFFRNNTLKHLGGRARAMVVSDSRLSAVRYHQAFEKYIKENNIDDVKTLVAFTGTVKDDKDPDIEYTEEGINKNSKGEKIKESQVPAYFKSEFNVLIVADKYQTGFDEPLLQTMFVDKALWGIKAVQTLSRLNRTMPGKHEVYVLDFVNDVDRIRKSFEPFYEDTILEEGIDYNSVYDVRNKLMMMNILNEEEIDAFGTEFYSDKPSSEKLNALIKPCVIRANALEDDPRVEFRSAVGTYCRRYSYVTQLIRLNDKYMQKMYVFCKNLYPLIRGVKKERYGLEKKLRLTHYKPADLGVTAISLEAKPVIKSPTARIIKKTEEHKVFTDDLIEMINTLHGGEITESDKIGEQLANDLMSNSRVGKSARTNTEETFKSMYRGEMPKIITKRHLDNDAIFQTILSNEELYNRVIEEVLSSVYRQCREDQDEVDEEN
jgi:type I restriction enzyme R subunit